MSDNNELREKISQNDKDISLLKLSETIMTKAFEELKTETKEGFQELKWLLNDFSEKHATKEDVDNKIKPISNSVTFIRNLLLSAWGLIGAWLIWKLLALI